MTKVADKIERQMKKEFQQIEDKVLELRKHHAFLVRMGREMAESNKGRKRSERFSNRDSDHTATSPR